MIKNIKLTNTIKRFISIAVPEKMLISIGIENIKMTKNVNK